MVSSRLLRQFVAVAEELHYGRAAARLHMAQPPLSQSIKRLEALVGVQLLNRSRHAVELTAAGQVFLAEARDLLAREVKAVEAARRAAEGVAGRVTIGFVGSISYELLPRILLGFRARFPGFDIDLVEQTSTEQIDGLLAGRLDVGLLRPPVNNAADLQMRVIHRERFVAVLPRGHRLARARGALGAVGGRIIHDLPGRPHPGPAQQVPAGVRGCRLQPAHRAAGLADAEHGVAGGRRLRRRAAAGAGLQPAAPGRGLQAHR